MTPRVKKNTASTIVAKIDTGEYELKEFMAYIDAFLDFSKNDIISAVEELKRIKNEDNRKHLQKLVYTNLVNRFDHLVDKLIVWLSYKTLTLRNEIFQSLKGEVISKQELYEFFFLSTQNKSYLQNQIENLAQTEFLRKRHSTKLEKIVNLYDSKTAKKPRVGNTGKIFSKTKKAAKVPNSIIGFADYLYCRRNSITHGDGRNYDEKDRKHIMETYSVNLPKNFRLSLASITTANVFYNCVLKEVKKNITSELLS